MTDVVTTVTAALPLVIAALLLVGALWPATKAMPVAWLSAVTVGMFVWNMPLDWIAATSMWGVMLALEILWIVFGALVLLYTLEQAGAINRITDEFESISQDHRVQTILVAFFLTTFLTGVAGFGTPAAIAAPLLVGLGFPPLAAVVAALVGHAIATTFGAVGVPIRPSVSESIGSVDGVSASEASVFAAEVSSLAGLYHLLPGVFVPLVTVSMVVYFFGDPNDRSLAPIKPIVPLAAFAGFAFIIPFVVTAVFIGPELPSVIAPMIGGSITVALLKKGWLLPATDWQFPRSEIWPDGWSGDVDFGVGSKNKRTPTMATDGGSSLSLIRAGSPYVLLVVLLVVTRDFTPLGAMLTEIPLFTLTWDEIFGTTVTNSIDWAYVPGAWLVLTALVAIPVFGLSIDQVKQAWIDAGETSKSPAIALVFVIGTVGIMLQSGQYPGSPSGASMVVAIADGIGLIFSDIYTVMAAPIGVIGTFVTGSVAVSNITFSALQYEIAISSGLVEQHVVAAQATGGAMGNAISIHNVIAALATVGLVGKEGTVIRLNLLPVIAYTAFITVLLTLGVLIA